jgi:hypothetical protein
MEFTPDIFYGVGASILLAALLYGWVSWKMRPRSFDTLQDDHPPARDEPAARRR